MGESVEYDAAEAKQEEAIYETPAAASRRRRVRDQLSPRSGETVLSIGCGPGFEPAELAPTVGADGSVIGIDRSEAMLRLARRRCADHPQVTLTRADADAVPVGTGTVDAAVAVQVYEYLEDVGTALAELARVLRPGGRAVVCDADFASLVWRSPNPARMETVLEAFDDHCPRPSLGSQLERHLDDVGLTVDRVEPNTIVNTTLEHGSFAYHLMEFVEDYAAGHDEIGPEEAGAWADDLRTQEECAGSFFSFTQYCYLVRKPK